MILSSTVEKTRVIHNPIDLSAYSSGGHAHKKHLHTAGLYDLVIQSRQLWFSKNECFFYDSDNVFLKSFSYPEKNQSVTGID
jgi:hypothetical protein